MKKIITVFIALNLLVACNKKETIGNTHITGNIKGLKNGTLYIQHIIDTSLVPLDTIIIDGKSTFESTIDLKYPEMLYLFLDRGTTNSFDNNIPFFAEPGTISIETELENYLTSAKIIGSKNQDIYDDYKKTATMFKDNSLDLIEAKFYATKYNNPKKIDSINQKINENIKRKYLYTANFALTHNDAEVSPYIVLSEIRDINLKYLDTIQKTMSPKVAQSLYGKKLTEFVLKVKAATK